MMKQAKKFLPLRIFFKILILRRRIKTVPDEIVEDEEEAVRVDTLGNSGIWALD